MTRPGEGLPGWWYGAVAAWCALWLVVGLWTGYELWQLGELGGAVAETGRALGTAGEALESLSGAPLVGERTGELAGQVQGSSESIVREAQAARGSLRQLAVLLGLTVSLVPSVPVVLLLRLMDRRPPHPSGS